MSEQALWSGLLLCYDLIRAFIDNEEKIMYVVSNMYVLGGFCRFVFFDHECQFSHRPVNHYYITELSP
jgi:hypothetical protein